MSRVASLRMVSPFHGMDWYIQQYQQMLQVRGSIKLRCTSSADCVAVSNGAAFLPNTFIMQEMLRAQYDQYLEDVQNDSTTEPPLIFSILKGW